MSNSVDIGRKVAYNELEKALIEAAKEIGWEIKFKDITREGYKLGSVNKVERYQNKEVKLSKMKKRLLGRGTKPVPVLEISIRDRNNDFTPEPISYFFISRPYPSITGEASEEEVTKYLDAVFRHLQPA